MDMQWLVGQDRGFSVRVRWVRRIQQVQVPGRADVEDRDVPLPVSDHLDSHAIAGVETDLVGRLRNLLHVPCQTPRLGAVRGDGYERIRTDLVTAIPYAAISETSSNC